jgi:hypothetical protein
MRTLVAVYATEMTVRELKRKLDEVAKPGWDSAIRLMPFSAGSNPRERVSRDWHELDLEKVFVEKTLKIKCPELEREGVRIRSCAAGTIFAELLDEVRKKRFHWLAHSVHEWSKAGIQHAHPQHWREQFAELGCDWVGEGLLKQLRVVSDAELMNGLRVPEDDLIGIRVSHGCVRDDEPGSSSVNVKDLLEHTYICEVVDVDFEREPQNVAEIDHLYVYEDGLWTGVELLRRLKLLAKWPSIQRRDLRVTFKFGVTADVGLCAARHFLRRERLTSINVAPGSIADFRWLEQATVEALTHDRDQDDAELRSAIDSNVKPFAFQSNELWGERSAEAMEICRSIGEQLVTPWQRREKGSEDLAERAKRWALGAFGYASLTCFSKSVPKPVLPLVWLNGPVELRGKTVNWEPLFWDARRTGAVPRSRNHPRA